MRFDRSTCFARIMAMIALTNLMGVVSVGCDGIDIRTSTPLDAPVYGLSEPGVVDPKIVPDSYIVVLHEDLSAEMVTQFDSDIRQMSVAVKGAYRTGNRQAMWVMIPPDKLDAVRRKSVVAWIEVDRYAERTGVQTCVDWNLDMLDHPSAPLSAISPSTMKDLVYGYETTGAKANVLVVDTGIRKSETLPVPDTNQFLFSDRCNDDRDGHGTQVAAIIGDKEFGVAKGVNLIPFNVDPNACHDPTNKDKCVLGCGTSCVTGLPTKAGLTTELAIIRDALQSGTPKLPTPLLIVFPYAVHEPNPSSALEGVIYDIVASGAVFIVSAGNQEKVGTTWETDACRFSPARLSDSANVDLARNVITVGAISQYGKVGSYNTGSCVDVFAPGIGIRTRTTDKSACDASKEIVVEGTSFAAAHVAGVAAQLLDMSVGPNDLKAQLMGITRKMQDLGGNPGSPDNVLHGPTLVNVDPAGIDVAQCKSCGVLGKPCCNGSPAEQCGAGLACGMDKKCVDCGGNNEPCCPNSQNGSCDLPDLTCSNGKCIKGCVTTCCDDTKVILGEFADSKQCIRQGGDGCWNHNGPKEILNKGVSIWAAAQCSSLQPAEAVCCDGTRIDLNVQFDEDVAKEVAKEACNIGPDSKMRETYMDGKLVASVYPDTCGKCDVLCCDGTRVARDYSYPNVSPEDACKLFGGLSCKEHGYGPQWIIYGQDPKPHDLGQYIWSKGTGQCPTMHPCIARCNNGRVIFVGDMFDEGQCNLFATEACEDYLGLEWSELFGTLSACTARCSEGQLIQIRDAITSANDCIQWAENECVARNFGPRRRVRFNTELVFDYDINTNDCGQNGMYCCGASQNGVADLCDNDPQYKCVVFDPPPKAVRYAYCSNCGGKDQPCCANAPKCGTGLQCNAQGVCQKP